MSDTKAQEGTKQDMFAIAAGLELLDWPTQDHRPALSGRPVGRVGVAEVFIEHLDLNSIVGLASFVIR